MHALLSASSAHRWMNCPGAPRLEATLPDTTSEHAAAGTLAHEMAEIKVKSYVLNTPKGSITRSINKLKKHELYDPEMDECTEVYFDYVREKILQYPTPPLVFTERRVSFGAYVPDGFGTADCVILAGDTVHIVDYKHGKGVAVSATDNPQLKLYALGVIAEFSLLYSFKTVEMVIVQPRNGGISEFTMTVDDLIAWGENEVKPKAQMAFTDNAEFHAGDWCKFCRARQGCKARSEQYSALHVFAESNQDPRMMSLSDLGNYLSCAKSLKAWADDLEAYALEECLKGHDVPGWKAVHGRTSRSFSDQDAAFQVLIDSGISESVLYERKPLTLAQTEKAIGKAQFKELVNDFVVTTAGKPTLAPESDKREAIKELSAKDIF